MTYEYVCEACGHQWEAEQSIKDRALDKCVSCGAAKAKRLVSGGTGFLLKGGGWYADLYGSPGASKGSDDKSAKGATPASKPDSSESKGSSDSKPSGDGKAASSSDTSSGSSSSSGSPSSGSTSSATPSAKAS